MWIALATSQFYILGLVSLHTNLCNMLKLLEILINLSDIVYMFKQGIGLRFTCIWQSFIQSQELDFPTLWSRTCWNDLWSTLIENRGFKPYKTAIVDWSWNIRLYSTKEGPTWKPSSSTIRHMSRPISFHFKILNVWWPSHESS